MIIKSLLLASILSNFLGLNSLAIKFSDAVVRDQYSSTRMAEASSPGNIPLPEISARPTIKMNADKPVANARHYLLADLDSGTILVKNDKDARVPIASTTKIMTAVVALENYKLDDVVTVSAAASTQIGADAYLLPGEKITVESLLNCMLIKSGNDSAYALAEHMNLPGESGVDRFVAKMNQKASELGMVNTKYEDPAGLNTTGYSSANDLFIITKQALKSSVFASIVKKSAESERSIDGNTWHELKNSNRLVAEYDYPGAIGVKTGYMPEAGHCLVGGAKRGDHTLISIVLNTYADTPSASADEARRLLDWGFQNITWR